MSWNWLRRLSPHAKGTPAGEVMLECLRRDVQLVLNDEGAIELHGSKGNVAALSPQVEQHKDVIFAVLAAFKYAAPPAAAR